jgi:tripeptide aminopeptidase
VGSAAYKAPTVLSFEASIKGKSAHAGFAPQNGIHAISAAAKAISQLDMGRIDEDTTLNVGIIQGGLATNIVPEHCVVKGEIRSYSHVKALEQVGTLKEHFTKTASTIGATVGFQISCGCEAYEIPLDHSVVQRFKKACEHQGVSASLEGTFGGSDNNHLAKHGISGIVVASAMNRCHSCEEYTTVEELHRIAELTVLLMTI